MKNIFTIIKKELTRVFTDRRMILSLFLLPPLTIYLIYGLMGLSAENENKKVEEYTAQVYVVNSPASVTGPVSTAPSFQDFLAASTPIKSNIQYATSADFENLHDELEKQNIDLIIEFPADFANIVTAQTELPKINLYYNINKPYSQNAYSYYSSTMLTYKSVVAGTRVNLDLLNVFDVKPQGVGDTEKAKGSILSMLLPMLLVIYLMAGAMGVGIESIAGEKERGTIATLLVTPIKRSQLAVGKIISIAILSVLSSICSFIGLIAVLPQFAKIGEGSGEELGKVSYSIADYGMLLAVMLVAVLLFVAMIVIISTYSRSIKEAGTLVMPVYLVVIGASFFNMFTQVVSKSVTSYIIPVYNVVVALKAIFSFDITLTNFLAAIISTAVYTGLLIFVIQKMFTSEKIMFKR